MCILILSSVAVAQTAQPKAVPSQQQKPAVAGQPTPAQRPAPAQRPVGWVVTCNSSDTGLNCRTSRSLVDKKTGRPVVVVNVAIPATTKKPVMAVRLPLGIYLPAGASVQFGQDAPKPLLLQRCGNNGCYAEYAITEADIAAMLKGADLTISAQAPNQTPLTYLVRAEGFPAAYAKIK